MKTKSSKDHKPKPSSKKPNFPKGCRKIGEGKQAKTLLIYQHDLLKKLTRVHDLQETLRMCLETALLVSGMECGGIYLTDAEGSLYLAYTKGLSDDFIGTSRYYPADTGKTHLIMAGKPIYISRSELDTLLGEEKKRQEGLLALAVIPMHLDDKIIGSLNLASRTTKQVSLASRTSLETIASNLALLISRAQVDDALHRSEENFRQLAENIHEVFWLSSPDLRQMFYISPAYDEVWGRNREDFTRNPLIWLESIHPEDRPRIQAEVEQDTGQVFTRQYRIVRPDGSIRWILARGFPVRDAAGSIYRIAGLAEDITEHKQAETALNESEKRWRALIENSADAIAVLAMDGTILYESPSVRKISGYSPDEVEGRNIFEDLHADDRSAAAELYKQILGQAGKPVQGQVRVKHKDQSWRWIEVTGTNFLNDPAIKAVVLNYRDITERRLAEDALRDSEERYRGVVEAQTEIISRVRADGTITFVNDVYCRFFGKTPGEIIGIKWQPLTFSEDLPHVEQKLKALLPTNPIVVIENRVYAGDGQVRWVQFVNQGFFDPQGTLTEIQCMGRDISERNQMEEALKKSETLFHTTFHASPIPVSLTDMSTEKWVEVNDAFLHVTGYTRAEVIGSTFRDINLWKYPEAREQMKKILLAQGRVENFEADINKKNGEIGTMLTSVEKVTLEGRPYLLIMGNEITKRKAAEEGMKELSRQLVAAQEAERKHIAQELHDELGQTLTAISLDLASIHRTLPPEVTSTIRERLAEARALVNEVDESVNEMALDLRPSLLDDLGLLPALEWYLKRFSQRSGIEVTLESTGLQARLSGEVETTLYRVVQEALTNVSRHAQAHHVRISLECNVGKVMASIEDDGVGFEVEAKQNSAESLHGMGLLGIKERVNTLKGGVEIHTAPGRGLHIQIEIPV